MGEVYRVRDSRLERDVALKVLHPQFAADADHVERFVREARAAGSLNHPNIVAVFDVGQERGVTYIVSELLEGETLRDRLNRGRVPYRKGLAWGTQIAQALGAAHERGIWHRDVKPANVFITNDGRVKLLDFGLARLKRPAEQVSPDDATASASRPGTLRGTVGYMSPEQVLGEPADHRSDIFALGAVLYELWTGARPFHRSSRTDAMTAVLKDDPADPRELNPDLPAGGAAVLRRCLEKNPEERFQSARDLAFHLQQLDAQADEPARGVHSRARPLAALAAILAIALAGAVLFYGTWKSASHPTFEQLTFRRGRIGGARFAADGRTVVYSEAREDNMLDVWRLDLTDRPQSFPLGYRGADVLAAHGGELALALRRRFAGGQRFVGTLAVVPRDGSSPRELAADVEDADWDKAGARFVVTRSTGVGGESRLEYPIGTVLHKTTSGCLRSPRLSPDGRQIAVLEDAAGHGFGGRVVLVDLTRRVVPLTPVWPSARGLSWSADGHEIWFTAASEESTNRALRAVDLRGRQRVILEAPSSLTLWDIARDGRVLLTRDDERNALVGVPPGESVERDLSWLDMSGLANISADGRSILFGDRFGIYLRRPGEPAPVHLGLRDGYADDLSPDGRWALATNPEGSQLILLPTGAGEPRPIPTHGIDGYKGALWFPDGQRILFNGSKPGQELRSYVQEVFGNDAVPPRPLTPEHSWAVAITRDGKVAAAIGRDESISLYPVAGGAAIPVKGSKKGERPVAFSADGRYLWVFRQGEIPTEVFQLDLTTHGRSLWKRLRPPDAAGVYSITDFRVTPDGQSYFYSYARALSQLYAVDGVR